jgi:hypothetical protein
MDGLSCNFSGESLRTDFLFWQCKIRQLVMREKQGRPIDVLMPELSIKNNEKSLAKIIVILSKFQMYSKIPEIRHIVQSSNDPKVRLEKGIGLLSEKYYSNYTEFSDILTASFASNSNIVHFICEQKVCNLKFEGFGKRYMLCCKTSLLSQDDYFYQATWWHNKIFNSALSSNIEIVSFEPNWNKSKFFAI